MSTDERTRVLYAMAQRPGGVTSPEAIAAHPDLFATYNCSTMLSWLARSGRATRKSVKEGKVRSRYFADIGVPYSLIEMRIKAKINEHRAAIATTNKSRKLSPATLPKKQAAHVLGDVKPVVVPGMPAFDLRYQVDPSTRVVGGFASLGPGRYLEDTRT